ncbi:hypothetical protein LTR66_005681 [Elasticomyces elasticus]|nr:hypothetical protein LTR66_005681 [Elasticomyces elasticus]
MAFGRSNSLSLNTGAANSIFGNTSNQPQQSGGLFGQQTASQPQQSGGLFGQQTASQPQQSAGLFGQQTTSGQPQQPGGLFGSTPSQPQQSGGLFGPKTASQPQQGSNLFGNLGQNTNQPQQQPQQQQQQQQQQSGGPFAPSMSSNTAGGGLFGNLGQNTNPQPQQQSGGLFGTLGQNNPQPQQSAGLFGTLGQNNTSQPQQSGGLFGNLGQNKPATTGLLTTNNQQPAGGLFGNLGASTTQTQNQPNTGLFGSLGASTNQQQPQNNLFGSLGQQSQQPQNNNPLFNASRPGPFAGGLTLGQSNQQATKIVPGIKIDLSNLRSTTRFSDLHEDLQRELERIDTFTTQQQSFAAQCEAMLPKHEADIATLPPDIEFVAQKVEGAEVALENDSAQIQQSKVVNRKDAEDAKIAFRVVENLKLPSQFHLGTSSYPRSAALLALSSAAEAGAETANSTDLVAYFSRRADEMQRTLATYQGNLSEIESHLRVVEHSALQQSQQLMSRSGDIDGVQTTAPEDPVRELADTLRGFESGILNAASRVTGVKEAVGELVLGGAGLAKPRGWDGRGSGRLRF